MYKVDYNQLIQDIERSIQKASEKNPLEILDQAKQIRLESETKMRQIIQAREQEIRELQNESETLQLKEATVSKNYKAFNQEHVLNEAELQKQAALQTKELDAIDELNKEIQVLELELGELEASETSLAAVPSDELRLGLYRGLGVTSQIINDKIGTIVLTTADKQDIRTMGLDYDVDYLSNQCWDFLSK